MMMLATIYLVLYSTIAEAFSYCSQGYSGACLTCTTHSHIRPLITARSFSLHASFSPLFDFTLNNVTTKKKSTDSFERIDDAIMGGISLSVLRDIPDKDYACWSGVCRIDGGGFCGMRTLPFVSSPLNATHQDGIYIDCWLASDDEADKRIWKMTVRTDSKRGEQVYQAQFDLNNAMEEARERKKGNDDTWARVLVPFNDFQLVRGPRLVTNGTKLNVSEGIYQLGMTMSKFKMALNTTELENFRPGFFELRIQRIGFYNTREVKSLKQNEIPDTLTKKQVMANRPTIQKLLLPIAKIFFSEKANRRKSAMKILTEKRGMSRAKAILFGIYLRKNSLGVLLSVTETLKILMVDLCRGLLFNALKIVFLYPLRLIQVVLRTVKRLLPT